MFSFFAFILLFSQVSAKVAQLPFGATDSVFNFVKDYLPPDPIIVEAGGFDGGDSLKMAFFWPYGQIYTFEPVPELFQEIKAISENCPNIHPYQIALSDSIGQATFYLSVFASDPSHVSASSSLLPPKKHLRHAPHIKFPSTLEVPTITLDAWAKDEGIDHVDFLWLDMQGYELNMIKASDLAKNARAIWMEVEFVEAYAGQYLFKDVLSWMEANDFQLAATNFNLKNPKSWCGDALFVKK